MNDTIACRGLTWPVLFEVGPVRYARGRVCPNCGCFLATDNPGPTCSPCEVAITENEIRVAVQLALLRTSAHLSALSVATAGPIQPGPRPMAERCRTFIAALERGPKTGRELKLLLGLTASPHASQKLHRCVVQAESRGYRINVGYCCGARYTLTSRGGMSAARNSDRPRRWLWATEYVAALAERGRTTTTRTVERHCAAGDLHCRKVRGRWQVLASELGKVKAS